MADAIAESQRSPVAPRPKPWGSYRRAVRIMSCGAVVRAEMEDDVHHFTLELAHADGIVATVTGEAIRTPWSICPGALARLSDLEGKPLDDLIALSANDRAQQCMHLFDLALLAARHAVKSDFATIYRVDGDFDHTPPRMRLWRAGEEVLAWSIIDQCIAGSQYDGVPLNRLASALKDATEQDAEAALILRRASLIAAVRTLDLDQYRDADHVNPHAPAVCFARQPERSADAARVIGSGRDFFGTARWPLS